MRNNSTPSDLWLLRDRGISAPAPWALPYDYKHTYALEIDGVGDRINPFTPLLVATTDTVPDDTGTGATLTVDATHTISTIDTVGDQDFYSVTLTAGVHYQIGMYGYTGGPSLTPLADSYVEIYDAGGTLVTSGDGGADTPANTVNSGFDVLLDFIPTATGTYFVNARAFDNVPADGTNGDMVGDYELFVQTAPPGAYEPYYDPDSPLYAIDWGTRVNRVNQTAANPDGNEGPRPTGNAQGTPEPHTADLATLAAAQGVDITGKNVITIYFAKAGEIVTSLEDPTNPGLPPVAVQTTDVSGFEHLAVMTALHEFAKVADVVYLEVPSLDQADFEYASYAGTPGPGVSLLGSMEPPDEPNEGLALFNSGDERWNALNLAQGGFSFVTLIHEIGHGHGLAHPHDNGGHSGIMRGVEPEGAGVADYTTGDYDLNQGVFTMMSYEDGWQSSPYGNAATDVGYGYLGSLMAFDIAAIQDKYGVNEEWATGDDTYTLKDVNAPGTYFSSIWDAGGTDSIVYDGARDATIDLRAATLQYEPGGGGRVSFAYGIFGGFTIANAVTIENARGGSGNDTLTGNGANNLLEGMDGNDTLTSGAGSDTVHGGAGSDGLFFGASFDASDSADGGADFDQLGLQGDYSALLTFGAGTMTNVEQLVLIAGDDTRFGDPGTNLYSYDLATDDANVAAGQQLIVSFNTLRAGENVTFDGSAETDGSFLTFAGRGVDTIIGGDGSDGFFFGYGMWGASDGVRGGGDGFDQLGLQSDYTSAGAGPIAFGAGQLSGIDMIVCLTGGDARYGAAAGQGYSYDLTMNDANVAAGETLYISANRLQAADGTVLLADETLTFDGSAETNGRFIIYSGAGADHLTGGAGDDTIYGGGGADEMTGGAGNDLFAYIGADQSTAGAMDRILDFAAGDRVDLSTIDAVTGGGDDAFSFVGGTAFSHTAGELRAVQQSPGHWQVEGDIDGDGTADLVIAVTTDHALAGADFVL